jgi:putative ABC transport system substrate-binding protein
MVTTTAVTLAFKKQIIDHAARLRLPAVHARDEYVTAGGLVSYGRDTNHTYRRVADYVHRILKGAKPAELPVEQISVFRTVLNLKTAKALGMKVPQSVLVRADHVIE